MPDIAIHQDDWDKWPKIYSVKTIVRENSDAVWMIMYDEAGEVIGLLPLEYAVAGSIIKAINGGFARIALRDGKAAGNG